MSATAIVRVQVTETNDNRPIFSPRNYNVTLRSAGLTNEPILRVSATDLDSNVYGQVTYSIINNYDGIFRINSNTGDISVDRPSLIYRSTLYELNITATDAAGLRSTIDAEIKISTFPSDHEITTCEKPRYVISVKENVPVNTVVGVIKDTRTTSIFGKYLLHVTMTTSYHELLPARLWATVLNQWNIVERRDVALIYICEKYNRKI